jgi:hypothetical protein
MPLLRIYVRLFPDRTGTPGTGFRSFSQETEHDSCNLPVDNLLNPLGFSDFPFAFMTGSISAGYFPFFFFAISSQPGPQNQILPDILHIPFWKYIFKIISI